MILIESTAGACVCVRVRVCVCVSLSLSHTSRARYAIRSPIQERWQTAKDFFFLLFLSNFRNCGSKFTFDRFFAVRNFYDTFRRNFSRHHQRQSFIFVARERASLPSLRPPSTPQLSAPTRWTRCSTSSRLSPVASTQSSATSSTEGGCAVKEKKQLSGALPPPLFAQKTL
jgi:hypothetical protein